MISSQPEPEQTSARSDPALWVDQHGDVLYRFALLRVKDPQIAEDLVQDTFLAALQQIGEFRGRSSLRTWLVGILKHKIVDHFRRSAREPKPPGRDSDPGEDLFDERGRWKSEPVDLGISPQTAVENKEFWEAVMGCLDGLPDVPRRAFALKELDGLGTEEIRKILSLSATNLYVILHRARESLRRCLERKWGGRKEAQR